MAAQSPLRRWKRFLPSFAAIDDAIEAADPELPRRDEFRRARGKIVEMICDAEDDRVAEKLCRLLDEMMAEALVTLQMVPVTPETLAETHLAEDVRALTEHEAERVRALASGIVGEWTAYLDGVVARATAARAKLSRTPQPVVETVRHAAKVKETPFAPKKTTAAAAGSADYPMTAKIVEPSLPKKSAPVAVGSVDRPKTVKIADPSLPKKCAPVAVGGGRVKPASTEALWKPKIAEHQQKKAPADVTGGARCGSAGSSCCTDEKAIAATKRKLREGYEEAEEAKRQRKIQVIQAPAMLKQKQRKMHPILRVRSQVNCATSMAERSRLISSLQRV